MKCVLKARRLKRIMHYLALEMKCCVAAYWMICSIKCEANNRVATVNTIPSPVKSVAAMDWSLQGQKSSCFMW